jgi:hypothetical protein
MWWSEKSPRLSGAFDKGSLFFRPKAEGIVGGFVSLGGCCRKLIDLNQLQ